LAGLVRVADDRHASYSPGEHVGGAVADEGTFGGVDVEDADGRPACRGHLGDIEPLELEVEDKDDQAPG
jgi:hypothetical protein